jgi:hypothetical protein
MKLLLPVILLVLLSACAGVSANESPQKVGQETANQAENPSIMEALHLEDRGPAPELTNQVWLNTDHPLRLAELRGKVVLLEMWTFG